MKINSRENYGFGTSLGTKHDRLAVAAFTVLFASIAAMFVTLLWI